MRHLMIFSRLIGLLIGLLLAIAPAAEASLCRTVGNQQICIVTIKRSAKNYWEYRAEVSIDNSKRSLEVYNCRDRLRTRADGTVVPFKPNGAGALICRMLKQ
jgi:hypothetical protein